MKIAYAFCLYFFYIEVTPFSFECGREAIRCDVSYRNNDDHCNVLFVSFIFHLLCVILGSECWSTQCRVSQPHVTQGPLFIVKITQETPFII